MATDLEFVDSHVHYWQPSVNDWYAALRSRPIYRDILPCDFPAGSGHVHVSAVSSPRWAIEESRWLERVRQDTGLPSAIIGTIDPAAPFAAIERDLRIQAQSPAFRGVRVFSGLDPAADTARRLLRLLADQSQVFDLIARQADLTSYLPLVERSPDTVVVLEHAGWPDPSEPGFRPWREVITSFAAFGNVDCKISGLGMALGTTDPERLRPYVETCLELFGIDRCMFASNFPVDSVAGTYDDLIAAYRHITSPLGAEAQHKLFAANARRRYRLLN
ncbi:amidohydrolase [Microbispora sp. NPDC049125]|uniref:amidohydrolase family protein n=1 Tax=Microbispora sp. NPDC049125 TaxID=3154929 RepID=UPI0034665790